MAIDNKISSSNKTCEQQGLRSGAIHQSSNNIHGRRPYSETIEDMMLSVNWLHVLFKVSASLYLAAMLWLCWLMLPLPGHWQSSDEQKSTPQLLPDLSSYFDHFDGSAECNIQAADLYVDPPRDDRGFSRGGVFCRNREILLQAMSEGGRIGFDAPYTPRGCHYRWFEPEEICFILDRFDGVVFIGDESLRTIYGGLNVLLRQDLAMGAVTIQEMNAKTQADCRCQKQFERQECLNHVITSNDQAKGSYVCERTPHAFIDASSPDAAKRFRKLVPRALPSDYRPIPVIHSISSVALTASPYEAQKSLSEYLDILNEDDSRRKTPMLWIGPTAAGHIEIKGRRNNQEIWEYHQKMSKVATEKDIEVLSMWNMSVQASSWDGIHFGERVAITQAMMVLNWLSRLESS